MTRSSGGRKHKASKRGFKYSGLRRKLTLQRSNSPVHYQEVVDDFNLMLENEQEEGQDGDVKLENEQEAGEKGDVKLENGQAKVAIVSYTSSFYRCQARKTAKLLCFLCYI